MWGGLGGASHRILMPRGLLGLTCGQAGAQTERGMDLGKRSQPHCPAGPLLGQHPSSCLSGAPGPLCPPSDTGRGSRGPRSRKSLHNSHISCSHTPQDPFMRPRCPREGEAGRPYPDLARNGAWHRGPRCRCATSVCSRHGPPSFPYPALPTPRLPAQVARIRPGNAGCHRPGSAARAGPESGDRGAWVSAPRWGRGPPRLLVGEAVGVGEELRRGEPIVRHVAGAAADQVVRHAAGGHRDPT